MTTLIWQEKSNRTVYRIQTDEFDVHDKLRGRNGFTLAGEGMNVPLWVYRAEFESHEEAQKILSIVEKS